ncbi:CDP-diacylglycerol--glycerol-3-phosphate 3-phosphatidyltransferase [Rhodobium orientis]|uniref:CDP-alcohol phosphatidyltransferase n=1 Tax=Rhodobium orientis TaxID=34017 RepID=A0A327JNM3_9HYPH|nr:CDP-alcohol phosphatidyltransferase family protein [Rhodobium orientis]MBB4304174.1 CDP-diacylglycerol--glycerol-3-phosphate 3-phosphatidyltransferase [Rhodobium orientis]MBK5950645.1 hypothetical protein [Rhodobium orientis]RAI28029.1 hypothetical protein CH339_07955 [Rhodobium orientis]
MATVYDLKPRFQALLRPLVVRLAEAGITPNEVTLFALVLSAAGGSFLVSVPDAPAMLLLLPVVLFARMALNAIDGMLAREHDMKTRKGAVLNEIGDVLSDLCLYLALIPPFLALGAAAMPVVAFCLGAVLTEFAGLLGQVIGGGRRYDGPMGKSDRALAVGVTAFLIAVFGLPVVVIDGIFVTLAIATVLTVWKRLDSALKAAGDEA